MDPEVVYAMSPGTLTCDQEASGDKLTRVTVTIDLERTEFLPTLMYSMNISIDRESQKETLLSTPAEVLKGP